MSDGIFPEIHKPHLIGREMYASPNFKVVLEALSGKNENSEVLYGPATSSRPERADVRLDGSREKVIASDGEVAAWRALEQSGSGCGR